MRTLDEQVLDVAQLRDISMDDEGLMREFLMALIDDTTRQLLLLAAAIDEGNAQELRRLAHYSKGACASLGANRAAKLCKEMETQAAEGAMGACGDSLAMLREQVEVLRCEAQAFTG